MKDTLRITELNQIRLLGDPFKLELLQAFTMGAKTTKQVASELGESITRLYRHVDALHAAGLLEITGEKQKRGTVERTFQAVARRFEADPALFADEAGGQGLAVVRDMLRACESEILDAIAGAASAESEPIVMRLRCRGTPQRIAELGRALTKWIEDAQDDDDCVQEDTQDVGALIALYPIEGEKSES